jgi:uncharacterized membrane protein
MKKEEVIKNILLLIGVIFLILIVYKIDNYFNARIAYQSIECSDRAYMIYKNYDNQTDELKDRDWSLRNSECSEVDAKYQSGL